MNSTFRSQVLPLVQADNADMMVENMVMIMNMVSETDLVLHLLWIPNIIYRKELEEMSEMRRHTNQLLQNLLPLHVAKFFLAEERISEDLFAEARCVGPLHIR